MKDKEKSLTEFELGTLLSRIESKQDHVSDMLERHIDTTMKIHEDHEKRLRSIEGTMSSKADVNKVHGRVDKLDAQVRKIVIYLAAGSGTTILGTGLYKVFIGG